MKNKNSLIARFLALTALVGAVVVVFVVVDSETGNDEPTVEKKDTGNNSGGQDGNQKPQQPTPKFYVVQQGDTLTVIARKNGIGVARIEALNPDLDPQALIPGQRLKLR